MIIKRSDSKIKKVFKTSLDAAKAVVDGSLCDVLEDKDLMLKCKNCDTDLSMKDGVWVCLDCEKEI